MQSYIMGYSFLVNIILYEYFASNGLVYYPKYIMEKETLISSSTISSWFTFVMPCRFKWASPRIKQVICPAHHNSSNIDSKYQNANGALKWTFHPPAKGSKTRKSVQVDATECSSVSNLFIQPCVGLQREITTRLVTYSTHTQKKHSISQQGPLRLTRKGGKDSVVCPVGCNGEM